MKKIGFIICLLLVVFFCLSVVSASPEADNIITDNFENNDFENTIYDEFEVNSIYAEEFEDNASNVVSPSHEADNIITDNFENNDFEEIGVNTLNPSSEPFQNIAIKPVSGEITSYDDTNIQSDCLIISNFSPICTVVQNPNQYDQPGISPLWYCFCYFFLAFYVPFGG